MGGIADEHVEWAVVNRLKAMLDDPPATKFNVTQTFSLFGTVLLWTKNRAWVGGDGEAEPAWFGPADKAAREVRAKLEGAGILDEPWLLSRRSPELRVVAKSDEADRKLDPVNSDFVGMSARDFIKWLRDAFAHGDGRNISPIHRHSDRVPGKTWLLGFRIRSRAARGSDRCLTVHLYETDMRRIVSNLANLFCRTLANDRDYFLQEVGTMSLEEVKQTA